MTHKEIGPDLSQRRAKAALDAIKTLRDDKSLSVKEKEAYRGYVKSMPAAILMTGLGQALATELAQGGKDTDKNQGGKSPKAHRMIYHHIQNWLCGNDPEAVFRGKAQVGDDVPILLQCLFTSDQKLYVVAQAEALAYLTWLKKFANALLQSREEG